MSLTITDHEKVLLDLLKNKPRNIGELENIISVSNIIPSQAVQLAIYSLFTKGLIKLNDELKLYISDEETNNKKDIKENHLKVVDIDTNVAWLSDDILNWAFDKLEQIAADGYLDSIAIAVRYSDRTYDVDYTGDDLVALLGVIGRLYGSIDAYIDESIEANYE